MASPKLWLLLLLVVAALAISSCTGVKTSKGWAGPLAYESNVYAFSHKARLVSLNLNGEPTRKTNSSGVPEVDDDNKPVFVTFPPQSADAFRGSSYSTPALSADGSTLILTVRHENQHDSLVIALDRSTLRDLWIIEKYKTPAGKEFKFGRINDELLIANNTVYASSLDHRLYALNASNGTAAWDEPYDAGAELWTTPVLHNDRLYVGDTSGELVSIDPKTGRDEKVIAKVDGAINMSPLIIGDTAYFGTFANKFYAVNLLTGAQKWSTPLVSKNWFWARPVFKDGIVYIAGMDSNLYAMDAATGAEKWRLALPGPVRSGLEIVDNNLILATVNHDDEIGRLLIFDISRRETRAPLLKDQNARNSVIAPLNIKDKTVYFTNINGEYFAYDLSQQKILWDEPYKAK